jgi:hypothetical protein
MPELMQLDIGTSIRRYAPPIGTAGLARCCVSGNRRVPAPPPRMMAVVMAARRAQECGARARGERGRRGVQSA